VDNREIYDEHWDEWQKFRIHGPMSRHVRRLTFKEICYLEFSSLLDAGCGTGQFLLEVAERYPNVKLAGIDVSARAIENARRNVATGHFWVTDISKEQPPGKYDLITMIDVAEHIDDDRAAFMNLRAVCCGHLLVLTLEGRMRSFEPEVGHVRNYGPGELQENLEDAGFVVERLRRWGWPMYSPAYRDMSGPIAAHRKKMTTFRRLVGYLAYYVLMCNWPGKGDLVIALAAPKSDPLS